MRRARFLLPLALVCLFGLMARSDDKPAAGSAREFTLNLRALTDDPAGPNALALAKAVVVFVEKTEDAEVIVEKEELTWCGDPSSKQGPLLLAAYLGGNTQAQLDSGHRGNDMYPGLLQLFRTYRALREKDPAFKIDAVEKLLKLHAAGKLAKQVQEWEAQRRPKKEL
jgi:hypothetical protein